MICLVDFTFDSVGDLCDNDCMNFEQPQYRQTRDPSAAQQQSGQNPAEVDPSAVIAARSAAVARNRQKSERAAFLRDGIRLVGVIALLVGLGWIVHIKHQQKVEEERRQAQREEAERARRAKEQAERDARAAAARKERQEQIKAAQAEALRRREEEKRAAAEKAEARRVKQENMKRYQTAMDRFRGAALALISSAPAADIPVRVSNETWFSCLVPGGRTGVSLYEIRALPNKELHVSLLDEEGNVEEVKMEDFNGVVSKASYLLSKGSMCYYSPRDKGRWELRVPVPAEGETIDPSLDDFRDLHEVIKRRGVSATSFSYEVFFQEMGSGDRRILVVPFGGKLTRSAVQTGLQSVSPTQNGRGDAEAAVRARLNAGRLVIRRKGARR